MAAAFVAISAGIPGNDTAEVIVESAVGATAAGAVAAVSLLALRRSSVQAQAIVAALAPVLAVAIGVTWATSNMFITAEDLRILWVVLVSAGSVGVAAALVLGARVAAASREVQEMARRLGEDGPVEMSRSGPAGAATRSTATEEMAVLAAALEETSDLLARAQLRAEATERSRRELVAWVSHDLRTPLAGIKAMVEALEDRVVSDPDTVERYYATIRSETDRLAGLVDDLFELSRMQSGVAALSLTPVPLGELVMDALDAAEVPALSRGVRLEREVRCPAPVVEVATAEMLRVLLNLLDNAIRHTRAGGTVTLSVDADPPGRWVELSVLDECGGIPAADLERVFEMGYRADSARTPGEGRGGLGLAVAQGLVEAHGGSIAARNVGAGCCFTVRLPLNPVEVADPAP